MISVRHLDRVYPLKGGPYYALRNINLAVNEGDFLSIMGPSGSGKSTLLHILGLHDDEPTGNLHSDQGREIMELFKKLNQEDGVTIIQVTHSNDNAAYGTRIVRLADGMMLK